ncbi:MAG: Uncharacterised protein [Bacteroidota bacterium]|nr:MAG: Uncharacterised protein [Bacteroidota bacterium]
MVPVFTIISLLDSTKVPIFLTTFSPSKIAMNTSCLFKVTFGVNGPPCDVISVGSDVKFIVVLFCVLTMEKKDMSLLVVLSIPASRKRFPKPSEPLLTIAPA